MRKAVATLLLFICGGIVWSVSTAAQDPKPAQQEEKISIRTAEVVLDAIVKDRKGKPVNDLNLKEVRVFEDGVQQKIESFQMVNRRVFEKAAETGKAEGTRNQIVLATPSDSGSGETTSSVSAIALVFDRMSGEGKKRARDAAMKYLGDESRPDDYIGVFNIDLSMRILQNYSTDLDLIKQAVERAATTATSSFASGADAARSQGLIAEQARLNEQQSIQAAMGAGSAGNSGAAASAGAAAGAASVDAKFAEMMQKTLETFEVLERDQQGYATTNGLLSVVNSMQALPGRKAVIFFSEGLSLPPNVLAHFRSVINQANRSNVSVYTVDSAGLRTISTQQQSRDEINAYARRRLDSGRNSTPDLSGPMTQKLERNEDLIRLNPQAGLAQLADETGGTFIGNANDLGDKLRAIDEDMHSYYMITYVPTNQVNDGKFREIALQVDRPGVDVQSRKGYYAISAAGSSPVLFYESPALAILGTATPATAFPMMIGSLNFPEAQRPGRTAIEVQAPAGAFTFFEDKDKKSFTTNFSIVVLIRDESKQIVSKLSQQYILTGTSQQLEGTKKGAVLFYRETDLPPGKYEVEAVAYDAPTEKASRQKCEVEIPEADTARLRLSSISIIQRAEPVKEKSDSPFQVGDLMIYPNLGEPVSKAAAQKIGFYFNVYPASGPPQPLRVTLQVLQQDKALATVNLKPGEPDDKGKIAFAGALPVESLAPGTYTLKIIASDANRAARRQTSFTLAP